MLDCEQVLELVSAKLDGALTAEESAALEEHLAACPACRALLADFEILHEELPRLAAQPPTGLKQDIMAAVRQSKVTPFQGKKRQWRWRSLASLAAVLVLVVVGGNALRQWDGAEITAGMAPAAGGETVAAQSADVPAPAAAVPDVQKDGAQKNGRSLDADSGSSTAREDVSEQQKTEDMISPAATPAPVQTAAPSSTPGIYSLAPEERVDAGGLMSTASAELTQEEAVKQLALWLGWPEDALTADDTGKLVWAAAEDGTTRAIRCSGLNEAGTEWVCQVEEFMPGADGTASCTTYTVPLDGSGITQPKS